MRARRESACVRKRYGVRNTNEKWAEDVEKWGVKGKEQAGSDDKQENITRKR